MKKMIIASAAVAALLTSAQADFNFGAMFKDLKEAALTISKDGQDAPEKVSAENTQYSANSVSTYTQNAQDTSKSIVQK